MRGLLLGCLLWGVVVLPAEAVTPSPALTDREIAERLTRLETRLDEGLTGLREEMVRLRTDMLEQNRQLRADMGEQNRLLREDMGQLRDDVNIRFEEQSRLILGLLAVFGTIIAVNIGLVVWDRRTAVRPLADKVTGIAEELAENRSRLSALLEAFRELGQQNQTVAAVLKRFNLL